MSDKTHAFEGGDDVFDRSSPRQSPLSDDSGVSSTAVWSRSSPSEERDQWIIDSSPGCFSNTSDAFADPSGSPENIAAVVPLEVAGKNRNSLEADAPGPSSDTTCPGSLDDRLPSLLPLPSQSVLTFESPSRTCRKRSRIPKAKSVEQEWKITGFFPLTFEGTKRDTHSSSESDFSTESDSVRKGSSVSKMKKTKTTSTSRSLNISMEDEFSRLDTLKLSPMQRFLTPPSLSEGDRLSKSSPRKRLQSTQLDRPKSTSPGTSYSKLYRNSSVDNVHRIVPNFEVNSPEGDASSENRQSLYPKISGSPRHAELVSESSSLVSPSSGRGFSTLARPLSSEAPVSTLCDSNFLSPPSHFDTSSYPSQHASPTHLNPTAKAALPFGPRILYSPVQHACHLPRLGIFSQRSPILNFPHLNRDLKGTRIRPLEEARSITQVSKHKDTDKTDEHHVRADGIRTSSDSFLQKVGDKIKDSFRSPVKSPKLLSSMSTPSGSPLDAPKPSEAPLDAPGPCQASLDAPGPCQAPPDALGSCDARRTFDSTLIKIDGIIKDVLRSAFMASQKLPLNSSASSENSLEAPGSSTSSLNSPDSTQVPLETPRSSTSPINSPDSTKAPPNSPRSSETPRNVLGSSESELNAPKTSETLTDFPVPQAPLVVPRTSHNHFDSAPFGDFHSQSSRFQSTSLQTQSSSNIQDLFHSLLPMYIGVCERASRLSTSNRPDDASVPSMAVGPGEESTSSYHPSSSSNSPQSSQFLENVSGLDMRLPSWRSSDYMEQARTMFREICRDILRDTRDNRWLEFNSLSRIFLPAVSDNIALKFNRMMSKSDTEKLAERLLSIIGLTRSDMLGKECLAVKQRETVLFTSFKFFIKTISSTFSSDLDEVLEYYKMFSALYDGFMSFKKDTLNELDSADHSFRQRMPLLLDQISSYFAKLLLALQNLLQYFRESVGD